MSKIFGNSVLLIGFIVLFGCTQNEQTNREYTRQINNWHNQRVDSLTQDGSWLSLAGLYWLEEGTNSFGSDSTNDIVFPSKAPAHMGEFILQDSTVQASIENGITVTTKGGLVHQMQLKPDVSGNPTVLSHNTLMWYVIKRGNQYGIRLKDSQNEVLQNFSGIERFPVDKKWQVNATFEPFDSAQTMNIPTVLDQPAQMQIPGTLKFQLNGSSYTLLPVLEDPDDDEFFIVFGDKTNGGQTYGGGRFMYIERPGNNNTTTIDFNKAYNPPCVFTSFATCPLPPAKNKLDIAITAGEKMYGSHNESTH